jgi:hypothetical protein
MRAHGTSVPVDRTTIARAVRHAAIAVATAIALVVGPAYALSEWWTPKNATCPTFTDEDACEAWCRSNPDRCGGEAECRFRTGDQKPMC